MVFWGVLSNMDISVQLFDIIFRTQPFVLAGWRLRTLGPQAKCGCSSVAAARSSSVRNASERSLGENKRLNYGPGWSGVEVRISLLCKAQTSWVAPCRHPVGKIEQPAWNSTTRHLGKAPCNALRAQNCSNQV